VSAGTASDALPERLNALQFQISHWRVIVRAPLHAVDISDITGVTHVRIDSYLPCAVISGLV